MHSSYIVFSLLYTSILAGCPTDTACDPNFKKCYKYVAEEKVYLDAEESCQRFGGHLTSIQNVFENEVIKSTSKSMFSEFTEYWVGGNQLLQNTWTWTDGSLWIYTNWLQGEPENLQALAVIINNGKWISVSSDTPKPYVCRLPYTDGASPTTQNVARTTTPTFTCTQFCEQGWTYYNEFCYRVIPHLSNWTAAENYCVLKNSHLVSIHSEEENTFVSELTTFGRPLDHGFYTGAHKIDDQWVYTDGTKVDYFYWCQDRPLGSPTRNYIVIFPDGLTEPKFAPKCWCDYINAPVPLDKNFVCKKPKN